MNECGIWGTNFNQANLIHADFRKSEIVSSYFIKAMAYKADFSGAKITASPNVESPSNFTKSILNQAKFIKTQILDAKFREADLKVADFSLATVINCDFSKSNLTILNGKKLNESRVIFGRM